jgi:hypothetical protein
MLTALFPDIGHTPWDWPELAEAVARHVEAQGNAFVVYREDLDENVSVPSALIASFGAAVDDPIIEVSFGAGSSENVYRRWPTPVAAA